jgi:hypothetical protein
LLVFVEVVRCDGVLVGRDDGRRREVFRLLFPMVWRGWNIRSLADILLGCICRVESKR